MEVRHRDGIEIRIVQKQKHLDELIDYLEKGDPVGFDIETTTANIYAQEHEEDGIFYPGFRLVGTSFATSMHEAYYVPIGHTRPEQMNLWVGDVEQLPKAVVLEALSFVWTDKRIVAHNLKFEYEAMQRLGYPLHKPYFCTMLAQYVMDPYQRASLKILTGKKLGRNPLSIKDVLAAFRQKSDKPPKGYEYDMSACDIGIVAEYAGPDASNCFGLYEKYLEEMEREPELRDVFWNIEMPTLPAIVEMENVGLRINHDRIKKLSEELRVVSEEQAVGLCRVLEERFGSTRTNLSDDAPEFNPHNPDHVREILYGTERFQMPEKPAAGGTKKDGTRKASTESPALKKLLADAKADVGPTGKKFLKALLKWREISKLASTYTGSIMDRVSSMDGRVHPEYQQTGARTGRIACRKPNTMNLPRREDEYDVRSAFEAAPGHCFLDADYQAMEMRIVAAMSGDPTLLRLVLGEMPVSELGVTHKVESKLKDDSGEPIILTPDSPADVHCYTVYKVQGTRYELITKKQRTDSKGTGFGVVYGTTSVGLATRLDTTKKKAQGHIDGWFSTFPDVKLHMVWYERFIKENGYARTYFGRRRYKISAEQKEGTSDGGAVFRALFNATVQGTAADIMKIAMIRIRHSLRRKGVRAFVVLQVHDEIVVECKEEDMKKVADIVLESMYTELLSKSHNRTIKVPIVGEARAVKNLSKSAPNLLRGVELWKPPSVKEICA